MSSAQEMIAEFTNQFAPKVNDELRLRFQIEINPGPEIWSVHIEPGRRVQLCEGPDDEVLFVITTTIDILEDLYSGDISPLTAGGRARVSDPAPLDFRLGKGVSFSMDLMQQVIWVTQRFFNRFSPEKIKLGEEYSRVVHGGHAVAMFYDRNFRSAWYTIRKGERINEPGDTNPFPQAFIVLAGEGTLSMDGNSIPVRAKEAYLIAPECEHVLSTEKDEPLELIWLAWGEGA